MFILSWKNPGPEDRYLGMGDYQRLGVMAALDAVSKIVPNRKVHAAGYCLGGTLLTIAAATMGRDGDDRLASMTLLASQNDFSDAGELSLFISESEVSYLEHMMWDQGYLDTHQMAGAFHILRSNDLIRPHGARLYAWQAEAAHRSHGLERRSYSDALSNAFRVFAPIISTKRPCNRTLRGRRPPASVGSCKSCVPCFAVGTIADHVSPWRSVYKIHLQELREVTFVLTRGGHNTGIVSEPGHLHSRFQIGTRIPNGPTLDPSLLADANTIHRWFLVAGMGGLACPALWQNRLLLLGARESGYRPRRDAPGMYVLQR